MDAGKRNERVTLLALGEQESGYAWREIGTVWGSVAETGKQSLFSRTGLGEKGLKIILRKRDLTLHNALRWKERHCFLTAIRELDRMYLEIEAALVPVSAWTVRKSQKQTDADGFTRVVPGVPFTFPAAMTEKYLSSAEEKARFETRLRYILVTPKPVELDAGWVAERGGERYRVMLCHTLDEYKNEYEVERKEDD